MRVTTSSSVALLFACIITVFVVLDIGWCSGSPPRGDCNVDIIILCVTDDDDEQQVRP